MQPKQTREALLNAVATSSVQHSALLNLEIKTGKDLPKEKRLFKNGENDSTQGKFYFSKRSAELVMERAKEWGNRFHFDWDHHAYLTMSKGVKAPAAAWWDLEMKDDGLYAVNIEWTPQGKKDVEEDAYKYISPYFDYDEKTREVTKLNNAALTNLPSLKQLEALTSIPAQQPAAPPPEATMERKALLSALGLPENATDAELNARVANLNQFKQQVLATTGAKSEYEAVSGLLSLKASADETESLRKKLDQQGKDAVTKERDALLSAAVEAGQLEPGGDLKKSLEGQPVEMVKTVLSALPKKAGTEKKPPTGTEKNAPAGGAEASATLSQEQVSAAKKTAGMFEHDPAKVQEHWQKLAQAQTE